ncbi:hypothetical protein [Loktanella sp. 3ANDIMAR09]|uniref:hypothetical protein n=1 Tax=Loktanella sp. 3ANDIMAR09 TaxID=1225657 RepID=UPI000AFBA0D0|nr:hypothetical protein [Loktanella sp. 3ANDIMAR09]
MEIKTGSADVEAWNILEGPRVTLDASWPALKPCRFCNHTTGVLTGPKGPHADGVRCEKCYRHIGWLPPAYHGDSASDMSLIED